ncbi:hypothetical protein V6N13_036200 [Hibiscus sabdariffa]
MTLEALSSNELLNFVIYDTISATPYSSNDSFVTTFSMENSLGSQEQASSTAMNCFPTVETLPPQCSRSAATERRGNLAVQGRKKRRRKPRVCKNKEEAETQRMTHIAVERNRRKQMNEHLAVLRSLMPESYVQRSHVWVSLGIEEGDKFWYEQQVFGNEENWKVDIAEDGASKLRGRALERVIFVGFTTVEKS